MKNISMNPDSQRLAEVLQHDEDLIKVIRSHLIIEKRLHDFIREALPFPDNFRIRDLQWPGRIALANSLGLLDEYVPTLKKFNKIRNHFAHNNDAALTAQLVMDLYNSFPNDGREVLERGYVNTNERLGVEVTDGFKDQDMELRFIMMVISLSQMLEAARQQLKSNGRI